MRNSRSRSRTRRTSPIRRWGRARPPSTCCASEWSPCNAPSVTARVGFAPRHKTLGWHGPLPWLRLPHLRTFGHKPGIGGCEQRLTLALETIIDHESSLQFSEGSRVHLVLQLDHSQAGLDKEGNEIIHSKTVVIRKLVPGIAGPLRVGPLKEVDPRDRRVEVRKVIREIDGMNSKAIRFQDSSSLLQ